MNSIERKDQTRTPHNNQHQMKGYFKNEFLQERIKRGRYTKHLFTESSENIRGRIW